MHLPAPAFPPNRVIPLTFVRRDAEFRAILAWAVKADFLSLCDQAAAFLHPNELAHFRGLPAERRRRSYLLGRFAAKRALGGYTDSPHPTELEIAPGVFQQPVVRPGLKEPTGISISHSDRLACALAYSELHPLAIDVEDITPDRDAVMKTQILERELREAADAWSAAHPAHCTTIWTAKEALSKILHCGMTCPYELLAVKELRSVAGAVGGEFVNFGQYKFHAWIMRGTVLTIVLPRNSMMTTDLQPIAQALC